MGTALNQQTRVINWAEWSHIVDAAQDPRHRDAVQKFLAQAELTAEIPAAIDEKLLAPRRAAGATAEQCAYVLSNLGFAALVAGSKETAEFAMACGRLVEQLAPDTPDLELRRLFLATKGALVVAVLGNQPHLLWNDAAERCTAFLGAIDRHLDTLPAEAIESNAMAAYSFSGQFLSRILNIRALEHYADEAGRLVDVALSLASRLPSTFVTRMWSSLMPGIDAGVFFRYVGAAAERSLQIVGHAPDHARKGLMYVDEVLSRSADQSVPDLERIMQIRAELLLLSGRHREAMEQADALERSLDKSARTSAIAIRAKHQLRQGNPQRAAELLAQIAPTTDQALERWRATWMGEATDEYWTSQPDASQPLENDQEIWRLQAVAAVDSDAMPECLEAAGRATGFLMDSLVMDRQKWADRLRTAIGDREPAFDDPIARPAVANVEPMDGLDDVFARLVDGAALLQVVNTEEGSLTWVARKRNGDISLYVAPDRPNVKRVSEAHKAWSRAYGNTSHNGAGEAECAPAFSGLMDEVGRNWGDLLYRLVEDGITQLIFIGDDLVDIPLHAARIGADDERLIDRVPVSYVPSLTALRAAIARTRLKASRRRGVELCSMIDPDLDSAEAVAATLGTEPHELAAPIRDSFWTDVSAAQVLHIVARVSHDARMPFDSLLGEGWMDLSLAQLVARLDLSQCQVVANVACESALPSLLRAPGFDLAAIFLAAGARSVLASTWITRDDLASEFVQLFFRQWVAGDAPSAAFRDALLRLRSERAALPDFHWAGLRLVGAP